MIGSELGPELLRRKNRRIDIPRKLFLGGRNRVHNILERCVTDHQEIDVACRAELVSRRRPEHERDSNPVAERRNRVAEDVAESRSLCKQPAQFREDRRLAVGLKIDLTSLNSSTHQPGSGEQLQFALHRAYSSARLTCNLPEVVRLVSMNKQPGENPPAGAAEEQRRRVRR